MPEVKNILFPVDLSEASPKLVPWAKMLAEKTGAHLHLLFVARTFEHFSMAGLVPYDDVGEFHDQLVKGAEKTLAGFVANYLPDTPVTTCITSGYPAEEILEYAKSRHIDMIIMGTHGRKGVERIIFGSVAEHVVKNSPVPVVTAKPR